MQSQNRLLDDLARAASGALGALGGLKAELDQQVRAVIERALQGQDLVTREEFEAVREMAARARTETEDLRARLARLEGAAADAPQPEPPPEPQQAPPEAPAGAV